jgi:hypothetical protein
VELVGVGDECEEAAAPYEPDISSQSNLDPNYAAQLYMEQIQLWGNQGVSLGSPAIVWKLDWMHTSLNGVKNRGGRVDFICIHW